ncbi:MAG: hypothetical protein MIO93_02180 [ANME-2 cluster archaeon]|jgi:hypothetical protein|nr:hypothetical protein [ANME-2 cluster archaeon]
MLGKTSLWIFSFVFLVLLLFLPASTAEISYTFDIHEDGETCYIIEYRTLLDSQSRVDEFNNFKQVVEGNSTHMTEFEANMRSIVSNAGIATSRPMTASDFDISVSEQNTATGNYGIVRYSFKWTHLAEVSGSSIILGDVFFGGQYISNGDTFIVKIPAGYKVSGTTPEPDVQRKDELIWNGPRTFNSGEPNITFNKETSWLLVAGILILLLVAGALIYLKKNSTGSSNAPGKPQQVVEVEPEELESLEPLQPYVNVDSILESDEDMIISMLKESGGAMMQSGIVKNSGFSKSKTSSLLNKMAEDGLIQRVKKGRENLVRLV